VEQRSRWSPLLCRRLAPRAATGEWGV